MLNIKPCNLSGPIQLSKEILDDVALMHEQDMQRLWKEVANFYRSLCDVGVTPQSTAEDEAEMKAMNKRFVVKPPTRVAFNPKVAADLVFEPVYKDAWDRQLHEYGFRCACGECGCLGATPSEYVGFSTVEITMKCWRCGYEWSIDKHDVPNE